MNNRGVLRTLPPAVKRRKNARPPMPVSKPGFEILVPLELVPEYLRINGLDNPDPRNPTNVYEYDDMRQRLVVKKIAKKAGVQ